MYNNYNIPNNTFSFVRQMKFHLISTATLILRFTNRHTYSFSSPITGRECGFRKISTLKRKNFYEILNVHPTASKEEIKKAYFDLSKKYHPDIIGANASDSIALKYLEVKEAYEILCDEEKRSEHDQRLAAVEFRENRRKRHIIGERYKIYQAFGQSCNQREEGIFRQSLPNIMPSVESLSNTLLSVHWRRPFHNPTEEAQRQEKEAKMMRWFAALFITFLVAYYVSLRCFAHKKVNSGINLH